MKRIDSISFPKTKARLICASSLALLLALVCLSIFAGCSQQNATDSQGSGDSSAGLTKSADYANSVTVGKVSLAYPDGYSVAKEYGAGQYAGNFPDGVSDAASRVLLNESGSVMLTVVDADDAGKVGIDGLASWIEATPERLQAMKETQPEMYESLKNVERETPEKTTVNGANALRAVTKTSNTTAITYYLEKDGAIAGYVSVTLPSSEYESNAAEYESIVATATVG